MTEITDMFLVFKALAFAADKHRDQRRKDKEATPYINHPIRVATQVLEREAVTDPAILCAALLHDTIEDTETTAEELKQVFGDEICSLVLEVTDDKELDKPTRKQAQVDHAPQLSVKARAIKLADKISNLRDVSESPPPNWSLERRQAYFDWAKCVIDGLRGDWPALEAAFDEEYSKRPG
jgi:guanosine-3',5'-bis(diphosphate) 3'-pyrophosphohydrolase